MGVAVSLRLPGFSGLLVSFFEIKGKTAILGACPILTQLRILSFVTGLGSTFWGPLMSLLLDCGGTLGPVGLVRLDGGVCV